MTLGTRFVASLVLALGLTACRKKSTLQVPDVAEMPADDDSQTKSGAGITVRYRAEASKLRQSATWEMTQRSGGTYAEVALELSADIDVQEASDRLKVVWVVQTVDKLDLKGALQVEPGEDPKSFLRENGRGAYLSDLLGQADDAASQSLPENASRLRQLEVFQEEIRKQTDAGKPVKIGAGIQLITYLPPVLQLPSVPEEALPTGEPVTVEASEEIEIGSSGLVLPIETAMKWTLVKVDASGSDRMAELQFEGVAEGSTTSAAGVAMIKSTNEGMMLWNLDQHVPASYEVTRTETYQFGEMAGETTTLIRSEWNTR
jgi:hypothetical protein